MRSVAPFRAADLAEIEVQPSQIGELHWDWAIDTGRELEAGGNAFSLRDCGPDGHARVVFCGGAMERHSGYATLWSVFSIHRPRVPLFLTRAVRGFIAGLPHRRVDAMVAAGNIGACGWARLIGLREECVLRAAADDGGDMLVFVRGKS